MTASYVSARFEKTDLYAQLGKQRCVVRNLDDGPVPPIPSAGYRPTQPDELRNFLLIEYVNDVVGERLTRIATTADIAGYSVQALNIFEASGVDFIAAGVGAGCKLTIALASPQEWTSEEYPNVTFTIASVIDATHLQVSAPFPSFKTALIWSLTTSGGAAITSGSGTGTTRRSGSPTPLTKFLDQRMNLLFNSVPELDAFVAATKAGLDSLASSSTQSLLSSESYSSQV